MKQQKNIKISISNAEFNCKVLGNGQKKIIAFHGFGQCGDYYLPLAASNPECTIYSFDLPFHGETKTYNPSLCLSPREVTDLVQQLVDLLLIKRFSLIGFSIGAKLLFPIIENFSSRIDHVWLLAPDGIRSNFWYRMATETQQNRWFFRSVLNNHKAIKRFGQGLQSISLIDKGTLSFILKTINSKEKRALIYNIWIFLRKLKMDPGHISKLLNENNISVTFVLGKKDRLVTKYDIKPLAKKTNNPATVTLSCGHQHIIENFAEYSSCNFG